MHLGSIGAAFYHILGVLGTPGAHFGLILASFWAHFWYFWRVWEASGAGRRKVHRVWLIWTPFGLHFGSIWGALGLHFLTFLTFIFRPTFFIDFLWFLAPFWLHFGIILGAFLYKKGDSMQKRRCSKNIEIPYVFHTFLSSEGSRIEPKSQF